MLTVFNQFRDTVPRNSVPKMDQAFWLAEHLHQHDYRPTHNNFKTANMARAGTENPAPPAPSQTSNP
jgi:hypothetical protein